MEANASTGQRDALSSAQAVARRYAHADRGEATKKRYRSCLNRVGKLLDEFAHQYPDDPSIAANFQVL